MAATLILSPVEEQNFLKRFVLAFFTMEMNAMSSDEMVASHSTPWKTCYRNLLTQNSFLQESYQTRAGYFGYSAFYIHKRSDFTMLGIWGEYSAFGELALHHTDDGTGLTHFPIEHQFAWGDLYYGFPTPVGNEQGTATWEGIAVAIPYNWDSNTNAIDSSVRPNLSYHGFSTVTYDFSERDVDVSIELLGNHSFGTLEWDNIPQNHDGSFFLQGNHLPNTPINLTGQGYIDGDFYGPNAEEVAGVFQRVYDSIYLEGTFGGRRQ